MRSVLRESIPKAYNFNNLIPTGDILMITNNKTFITTFLILILISINNVQAESACNIACTSAEIAGEVACALDIFDEPECGIAVALASTACHAACSESSLTAAVKQNSGKKKTGLCDGKLKPKNAKLAAKFCKIYK